MSFIDFLTVSDNFPFSCICVPEFSFPLLFAPLVYLTTVSFFYLPSSGTIITVETRKVYIPMNILPAGEPLRLSKPAQCCAQAPGRYLHTSHVAQY